MTNKFRAWDKQEEEFVKDYPILLDQTGRVWKFNGYGDNVDLVEDRYVIEQYTGLKDKNGTEIYEGDVLYVEQIGSIDPYIPHKKNVAVRYEGRDTAFVFDEEVGFVIGLYSTPRELEVIGNIYENPELMERK